MLKRTALCAAVGLKTAADGTLAGKVPAVDVTLALRK